MDSADVLLSNSKTAKRLGTTRRTLYRWVDLPELNFPRPCFICGRRYFSQFEVDLWRDRRFGVLPTEHRRLKNQARAHATAPEEAPSDAA
jgi:predicted DNA-binding transcriptional regulator AlpA